MDMVINNKFLTIGLFIFVAILNKISAQDLPSGAPCPLLDGSLGVCKSAETCKWLAIERYAGRVTLQDVANMRCTFENSTEIVCCGDKDTGSLRKSQQACELYRQYRHPVITFHILNGTFAALGEFPHMAALGYINEKKIQQIDFKCGGSLVSERYVLTSAHCVSNNLTPILARLGTLNIITPEANKVDYGDVLDVSIESVTLHPEYASSKQNHDIALLYLAKTVPFNHNLHPACLYADVSDNIPNTELIVTGWGKVNTSSEETSPFLLKTNLTVVNLSECNITLSPFYSRKLRFLNQGHFCAYDPNEKSDACQGDSGGPIQIIDHITDNRAMPIIVGVTSFGVACGTKLPSVYARVAFYLKWIESVVWRN